MEIKALTNVGLVRELNEDNVKTAPEKNMAVVCDGMGGHAAGEVASQLAVDSIVDVIVTPNKFQPVLDPLKVDDIFGEDGRLMVHAIRLANRKIYNQSAKDADVRGMGTTVVAVWINNDYALVCHVGDSRVYRLRNGNLEQLTSDHSWVNELISSNQLTEEESKSFANKNVITRALGTRENVKVDIRRDRVAEGDVYLLCSDGLCGFVSDADILDSLSETGRSLDKTAKELIERANAGGGDDNITVALIRIDSTDEKGDFEKNLHSQTIDEETAEELRLEDEILEKVYSAPASHKTAEVNTRKFDTTPEKKKRGVGWIFLAGIIVIAILAYLGYAYDVAGLQEKIDDTIARIRGEEVSTESELNTSGRSVEATVFIQLDSFPDTLMDHTLYVDVIPKGPVRQYHSDYLRLVPGHHVIELKNDSGVVNARLNQTFLSGEIMLTPDEFKITD
jgi:PPM family protein phosphatase